MQCADVKMRYRMTAQDIWLRKYHELWEKLEENTKSSFCTALWKWLVHKHCCVVTPRCNLIWVTCLNLCALIQAWCDSKGFDTVMHPIPKCVIFLEDLLQDMVDKKSKDPFGTVRVARKALSKMRYCTQITAIPAKIVTDIAMLVTDPLAWCNHRELQRGVPPPYGEQFSKETLIKSASSKAFAATTEARIGEQTVMTWST